jgi:hypothetical protein
VPFGDHRELWLSVVRPHSGLQKPRNPLRVIGATNERFAGNRKTINIEAPPTNLGSRVTLAGWNSSANLLNAKAAVFP